MRAVKMLSPLVCAVALVAVACAPSPPEPPPTTLPTGQPTAVASAGPSIGDAPLTVAFDSSGSNLGTGADLTYSWDFGDGSPTDATPSPSHLYMNPGSFTARLTLSNSLGTSTSSPLRITVNFDPNPKYYVSAGGSSGPSCGPFLTPCRSVVEAQENAVANGIHYLRISGGNFTGPLSVVSGMNITGGWNPTFSEYGIGVVTTINGTGTTAPVKFAGVSQSSISGVTIQGATRTSGNAVGVEVSGGSSDVSIGSKSAPRTTVDGGFGPQATGVLVTDASQVSIENSNVGSGTTIGAGSSAYGVRGLGLSVINITNSNVSAQTGADGTSAPSGPAPARSGSAGANGGNAGGPSSPGSAGNRGDGGVLASLAGGNGGEGGTYSTSGSSGASGSGPAGGSGGGGGCGSIFGCGGDAGGGGAGGTGAAGQAGAAGANTLRADLLSVYGDFYAPTSAGAGTAGTDGSGGGGGGGGKSASASGGGGGGGGGGGRGGAAGQVGGTSGGGSFGVYLSNATANVKASNIHSATGGAGGTGQAAGQAGNGGNGGNGGDKSCCEAAGGGGGGGGGAGGGGGGAGGGAGGHSIALFHIGTGTLTYPGSLMFRPAIPAKGGDGGKLAPGATGGLGGYAGDCSSTRACGPTDGGIAPTGPAGPAGQKGPNGVLYQVWDRGTVVVL